MLRRPVSRYPMIFIRDLITQYILEIILSFHQFSLSAEFTYLLNILGKSTTSHKDSSNFNNPTRFTFTTIWVLMEEFGIGPVSSSHGSHLFCHII